MSTQVKLRRGTSLEHETFTGASAELTVDTTEQELVLHDGVTPGGKRIGIDKVKAVNSVADLRDLEPIIDGQQVNILGHTVAGIGGGVFYYDASDTTSPDNNGTVIVTAGGKRWKRSVGTKLTPQHFGALANGTFNDNPSAQLAADNCNGELYLTADEYYFADGGVSLDDVTSIAIKGVFGSTIITLKNDINGTAFKTSETNVCDSFYAEGFHVRCKTIYQAGTAQQALQSKNVNITHFENITTDNLSQFGIIVGHYETGSEESESVTLINCHVNNHGKTGLSTQVGIELIERNNANPGQAPHPFVKRKVVRDCSIKLNAGADGAVIKFGSAENLYAENIVQVSPSHGDQGVCFVGGSTVLDTFNVIFRDFQIDVGGTPRGAISCGAPLDIKMFNVNVNTTVNTGIVLVNDTSGANKKLTLIDCDFGSSRIVSLNLTGKPDTGRVIELNNTIVGNIDIDDGACSGISSVVLKNGSKVANFRLAKSLGSLEVVDSYMERLFFLNNTDAEVKSLPSIIFKNSVLDDVVTNSGGFTLDEFIFDGGRLGTTTNSLLFSALVQPTVLEIKNAELAKANSQHLLASESIELTNVSMIESGVTTVDGFAATTPILKMNNCNMEEVLATRSVAYNSEPTGVIQVRNSSISTVDKGLTDIVRTVAVGNSRFRGCVVQDVFVATDDV